MIVGEKMGKNVSIAGSNQVGNDLTQGPVMKSLLLFALPIVVAYLIQQIYSMVDLMVIGQFVGNIGTTGVSVGGEISDFLTPVATAFATAGQIYIGQLAGAKREKEQKEAIGSFLTLMMLVSIGFMVIAIVLWRPILRMLNCPEEAFGQAASYLIITCIGLPFIFGYNAVCGVLRGMGESKRPMIFIIIAAAANIFLDILLVAVIPLQAAGTAIATVVSQLASFIAAFVYMYRHREHFDFELKFSYFRMRKESVKIILMLGLPQVARSMLVRVSMFWVNARVNSFGIIASSTNGVGNKLQKFLEIATSSLSQAGGAMVSQNIGAEKYERTKKVVYCTCISSVVSAGIISLGVFFFPKAIFGIFTIDGEVLNMGVIYLHIMIIHFFASAVTSSFQCAVIGAGNAMLNFVIGIMDGIICKIGFSLIFEMLLGWGVYSYFWGTAVSRIIPGIICIAYFYSGRWKKRKLIKK